VSHYGRGYGSWGGGGGNLGRGVSIPTIVSLGKRLEKPEKSGVGHKMLRNKTSEARGGKVMGERLLLACRKMKKAEKRRERTEKNTERPF